jgi:hypothetical protein
MKKRDLIFSITTLFAIVLMLSFVSSLTINTPTASQAINGTFVFNVTTTLNNATNCSWSTTANSNFAITINGSANQSEFKNSTDTSTLTNAKSTTLTVVCRNLTTSETATRTFSIDNSDPSCAFTLDKNFVEVNSLFGISPTQASTGVTTITYLWNLTDSTGVQVATSTSASPQFQGGDLGSLGLNNLTLTVTNEVSKTDSCSENIDIIAKKSDTIPSTTAKSSNLYLFLLIGSLFVVILVVALVFLGKSKKGRR